MSGRSLPPACSPTDQLLVAIHDRLGDIHDLLGELTARPSAPTAPERTDGTVELTEPKRPTTGTRSTGGGGGKRAPAGAGAPRPAPRRNKNT